MDEVRTRRKVAPVSPPEATAELIAVIVAVTDGEPRVLTIDDGRALPSGPFELTHRSLQSGMRSWVEQQTHHPLGYVEQLYTFADRDRTRTGQRMVAISYLGLTREVRAVGRAGCELAELVSLLSLGGSPRRHSRGRGADRARSCKPGRTMLRMRRAGASGSAGSASLSAMTAGPGTRSWSCSATNCCGRRGWCRESPQAGAPGRRANR